MGGFREEGIDQARKGATRDGKRETAGFHAKTQSSTQRRRGRLCDLSLTLRLCVKLFVVLIEEDLEVAAHVGFEKGVFGFGRFPCGRARVRLR